MKRLFFFLIAIALVGAGFAWYLRTSDRGTAWPGNLLGTARNAFRTVAVERGDVLATISATGTVEPEEVVDVGAQVAGMIRTFGRDPQHPDKAIDYGSAVDEGTVLAKIDDALYKAQVQQAEANLRRAEAESLQARTKLNLSQRDWDRIQSLHERHAASDADYDTARANLETAKSAMAGAEAAVAQARASLDLAETNLAYTVIQSPVRGVIIDRRVNVGQTVVASLNAPSLFLIAKDLKRMQVWASVNEADVGHIRPRRPDQPGQPVRFTVDAFPDETFQGEVAQIRLNATMTQNVVTYTVVVDTDNSSGKLLPYLTANLQFRVDERHDVLRVPNAALRWRPQPAELAADQRAGFAKQGVRREDSGADTVAPGEKGNHQNRGTLWSEENGFVRPILVETGISDGAMTEIVRGQVGEGTLVVVGEAMQDRGEGTTNPFTPKVFGGRRPPQ